jgi:hypothetical protein
MGRVVAEIPTPPTTSDMTLCRVRSFPVCATDHHPLWVEFDLRHTTART